ncbi:hypothetical protein [Veillonella agrestimuris]|uniref:hypothetical protein n=1 Tax=Veillonella agrestimuris TaxID=2941340 RepID=UPI00203F194D|nr:hypothetical protein [Veillonella agrestimuris]
MKLVPLYRRIMIGIKKKNCIDGFITYSTLFGMMVLLVMALAILKITTLSASNTLDEMNLLKAHYDAERGARWFVAYIKAGGVWKEGSTMMVEQDDLTTVYIKEDPKLSNPKHLMSYGIRQGVTARIHMYMEKGEDQKWRVVDIKPY